MSKHTPGPWKSVPTAAHTHWADIVDERGYVVAQSQNLYGSEVAIDTARLIAAAPDLLAACKALLAAYDAAEAAGHGTILKDTARAAIAKAEGGAP